MSHAASAGVVLVGCLVLAGWAFDIAALKSVFPGLVTMKANTALAFMLAGVLPWLLRADTKRKQTEEALRESMTLFQGLFEAAPDAIVVSDGDGRILQANAQVEQMFGYSREELLGKPVETLMPERFRGKHGEHRAGYFSAPYIRVMGSGMELTSLRKDGSEFPVEVSLSPVATKQGTLIISLIRDITTRKRTEEALQRSEQLYRTLIDNIHDGVFVIQDGKMQFANEAFATMIGYTVEEVSGKDFRALVAPEDRELVADRYRRRQAGEDIPRGYEFRMLHKDQTTRVMVDMNAALLSSQGKVATMGTVQDITKRKRAEEVLQQEAQIAAALARVGRELIASLDASLILERLCQLTTEVLACDCTHVILWQPEQDVYMPVAVYGDTPEQWETLRVTRAPRETVSELLAQIEREEVMQVVTAVHPELLPAVFLRQVGVTAALWVVLRQGGEIIGALSAGYRKRTKPFTPQQERIARGVAQIASLALANAKLVEELTRANQLKSDFLATMSHELRTPLNIAMGYTDLLLDEDFGPLTAEQNEALQRVRKAAHKQLDLVIALLDVSRLEAGQAPVEMREVDMVELMEELRGETEQSVHEKPGLALEWWVVSELRSLYTDRTKLKIVLKNVLNNAVEFTEQGSITVDVRACDGGVEFCVADTGIGIAPEVLPVIFEMFRQGDSSVTRRHGGAGLGLYIVRRMLELLGGTIAVESEVGRGSTFRVWVPGGPGK